jgi:hypothetical protein
MQDETYKAAITELADDLQGKIRSWSGDVNNLVNWLNQLEELIADDPWIKLDGSILIEAATKYADVVYRRDIHPFDRPWTIR